MKDQNNSVEDGREHRGVPSAKAKPSPELKACAPFTPAPWVYVETKYGAYVDARGIKIQQHWPGLESPMQIRDNARLIAAAPALYEACRTMAESLNGSPANFSGMLAAHRKLDTAIAIAEGKQ